MKEKGLNSILDFIQSQCKENNIGVTVTYASSMTVDIVGDGTSAMSVAFVSG